MPMHQNLGQKCLLLLLSLCNLLGVASTKRNKPTHEIYQPFEIHHRHMNRRFFKFVTRPDIDAPTWLVRINDEQALEEGYWFVAPYQDLDQRVPGEGWVGPHIYDQTGELVWSGAGMFHHWNTFDFGATAIGGEQMLTVLSPHEKAGVILDSHYQVWKRVGLEHVATDMHAFNLIDGGSRALVITAEHLNSTEKEAHAIGFHGKGGCRLAHVGFAELNVDKPSPPVFAWRAYEHIGLDEVTYNEDRVDVECAHRWDILHANSIDKFADDDYLISARHSDAVYKVSHIDGSIVWRLGGVKSDFDFVGPGNAMFSRQHHAQVLGQDRTHTIISLLDNAIGTGPNEHKTNGLARGLILLLDTVEWTASVLAEYKHPRGHTVSSRGSFQTLPNGNAFLCWTYSSRISEHSPNGSVVMEAVMNAEAHTYRAFKHPWVGRPLHPPDVVSRAIFTSRGQEQTIVYVSWNGATEVDTWVVHQAHEDGAVDNETLASAPWAGFETVIIYRGAIEFVAVEALDGKKKSLGRSNVVRTQSTEDQGLPDAYISWNSELDRDEANAALLLRRPRFPYWAFVLGFSTCVMFVSISLLCSRRRGAIFSRHFYPKSRKYELLMSERI